MPGAGATLGALMPSAELNRRLGRSVEDNAAELAERWTERHLRVEAIRDRAQEHGLSELHRDYRDAYLRPLLRLLGACLSGGPEAWAAIYADERLRFVPGRAADASFLAGLLDEDEQDLARLCGDDDALAQAMAVALRRIHAPLRTQVSERVGVVMVGDCLMTEVRALAVLKAREQGIQLDIGHHYFSAGQGVGLDADQITGAVARHSSDLVALSFLTYDGIPAYRPLLAAADRLRPGDLGTEIGTIMAVVTDFVDRLRAVTSATVLLHGVCGLPLNRYRRRLPLLPALARGRRRALEELNSSLRELAAATENTIFIDEEQIVREVGVRRAGASLLPRRLTSEAMFHPSRLGGLLASSYADIAHAQATLRSAKVLLVDFDNTLWQGVMAEGEVIHERRRQRLLRELREAGVLLVALTKNSADAIRWDELELSPDDFVLHKIGWEQKAGSILEASQQLDLGLDSFVLIDDNPAERELVRQRLPEVRALDPDEPASWRALEWMLELPSTGRSTEAARRTELYREAAARRETLRTDLDLPEMMRSLELKATYGRARPRDMARVHELLARTNQFNTTTRRRSESDLRALLESERHAIYVASLGDKFGDLGLVGVVITERSGADIAFDSVVMSCRAMGFGLEYLMLQATLEAEEPWDRATGRYRHSPRNDPCAGLFASAGFRRIGETEWVLESSAPSPTAPDWLAVVKQ